MTMPTMMMTMDALFALTAPNWFLQTGNVLANTICWVVIAIGFVFTFLPIIPGQVFIVMGAFLHFFWLGPQHGMSWAGLGLLVVLMLLSFLLDYVAGAIGAKKFGATKWGVWGAIIGGLVGMLFMPFGLLLGPLAGAILGEVVFSRQHLKTATKSGWGSVLGTVMGVACKGVFAVMMVGTILVDIWWNHPLEAKM